LILVYLIEPIRWEWCSDALFEESNDYPEHFSKYENLDMCRPVHANPDTTIALNGQGLNL